MNYVIQKTANNDRWDLIAYRYLGNTYNIAPLIEANPHLAISSVLDEGQILKIPVDETTKNDTSLLPVWKKS
ncbi:MAG: tail protein X [Candidatus Gastranaerophilales bacterium]|nr:tail protein X [Candidatus Gastranaerophilales bacterium]